MNNDLLTQIKALPIRDKFWINRVAVLAILAGEDCEEQLATATKETTHLIDGLAIALTGEKHEEEDQ